MTDLYIDHRFHMNGRRLHHFLPLGQAFERCETCGDRMHRENVATHRCVYSVDRKDAAPVVVHSAQPMPPGWNDMMDEVRANMTEAGLIS